MISSRAMIAERLDSAKIVFGLNGEIAGAIDQLSGHSQIADLGARFRAHPADQRNQRYSYIGARIAMPHLRVDDLAQPELILCLSPDALNFNDHRVNLIILLITPATRPVLLTSHLAHFHIVQRNGEPRP